MANCPSLVASCMAVVFCCLPQAVGWSSVNGGTPPGARRRARAEHRRSAAAYGRLAAVPDGCRGWLWLRLQAAAGGASAGSCRCWQAAAGLLPADCPACHSAVRRQSVQIRQPLRRLTADAVISGGLAAGTWRGVRIPLAERRCHFAGCRLRHRRHGRRRSQIGRRRRRRSRRRRMDGVAAALMRLAAAAVVRRQPGGCAAATAAAAHRRRQRQLRLHRDRREQR